MQFFGKEFASSRVFFVVAMNFCVTFETNRNCIPDVIATTVREGDDVISLDFYAAKPMADTASPMAIG